MRPKLLTKRQQIGIFNCTDPIAVMREYVSFSDDVNDVALARLLTSSLDEFIRHLKDKDDEKEFTRRYMAEKPDMFLEEYIRKCKAEKAKKIAAGECEDKEPTETQKQWFKNLSEKDAKTIYYKLHGHIYPEVLIKMLDTFPKEVSKEILLKYTEKCDLSNEVIIRAISVLGKESKEIILREKIFVPEVFNKIFRVFGKEETKEILMTLAGADIFDLDHAVERKILRIYSGADLKDLLKNFIEKSASIGGELFSKIFDVCSSKEEIKTLLDLALDNDMDIWYETLDRIVEYFPLEEAEKYLDNFFENTSPGRCEYRDDEKKEYYDRLYAKQ